tara:strand:+ start:1364 stop:4393 length:3030 start_codon:yes stop_codon:yes gene_type:complete
MALVNMKSNLAWHGTTAKAPGKYPQEDIQNKITSYQIKEIKDQYNKFHIHDTPNVNRLSFGAATDQPFIIRGIQQRDGKPGFYGPGGRLSPSSGMIRGGLLTFASRLAEDTVRMGKFLISPKGLIWNIKQFGLQASNPNVETNIGIRPTKVFDPLSFASNVVTAGEGIHSARHGAFGQRGKYEDIQKQFISSDVDKVTRNRLAKLKIEMFGTGAPSSVDQGQPSTLWGTVVQGISNIVQPIQDIFSNFDGSEIKSLSGPGGPKSVYGIGYTTIRRTTITGQGLTDNLGKSYWSLHYSSTAPYESSTTPGSARTLEDKKAPGNSIYKTYEAQPAVPPHEAFLPNFGAETGGYATLKISNKFNSDGYKQSHSSVGGRFTGVDNSVEDALKRPKIDILTGKIDNSGQVITELANPGTISRYFETQTNEEQLVRPLVAGLNITAHIHKYLYGDKIEYTVDVIDQIKVGYIGTFLNNHPVVGAVDWDTDKRTNLYQKINFDQEWGNTNTPQLRESADRVFVPGAPTGVRGDTHTFSPSTTGMMSLGSIESGAKIYNYFTPDLKYFKSGRGSGTVVISDEGNWGHDYVSLSQAYAFGADISPPTWEIHGLDSQQVPTYNSINYAPVYTPSNPKVGASPPVGQQAISGQTTSDITTVDGIIRSRLDPLEHDGKGPEETGIKTIGGRPTAKAGTPIVYNYMTYEQIRNQQSAVTNPKRINEFRKDVLAQVQVEIKTRSRDILGYGGAGRSDTLNQLPPGGSPVMEDMVPFYIAEQGGGSALYFRAGINSISDSFSPGWKTESEIGRADPKIILEGFGRSISLDITVVAGSADELQPMWDKLNTLAGWTAPTYARNGYSGQFVDLTLGDIYKQVPCYISSLSFDFDSETPWEITPGRRLPKYCQISMEFTYIGDDLPQNGTSFFSAAAGSPGIVQTSGDGSNPDGGIPPGEDAKTYPPGLKGKMMEKYDMANDIFGDVMSGATTGYNKVMNNPLVKYSPIGISHKVGKKIFSALNPFD